MSDTVYRDYDQAGLDAQYNLRGRWPEHEAYFARWKTESAALRASTDCHLDLAYGSSAGQSLDIFPTGTGSAPLVAFIHGGYWQSLDKFDFSFLAPRFLEQGIAYASINYDLAPDARIGEMVHQVRRAFAWLQTEAATYGIDPARVLAVGHSAGGHLAAMILAGGWANDFGLSAPPVRGGCPISGVYDLSPVSLCYHQEVLKIDAEEIRDMSPQTAAPSFSGPVVCAVGSEETDEFLRQQNDFVTAWEGQGATVENLVLDGYHHFSILDVLLDADEPLTQRLVGLALAPAGSAS